MSNKYWDCGDVLPEIEDLIVGNVIQGMQDLMDEGELWIYPREGELIVNFNSFEKPEKEGERTDIWHKKFNLLDVVLESADQCNAIELEEYAKLLDQLAYEFRKKSGLISDTD